MRRKQGKKEEAKKYNREMQKQQKGNRGKAENRGKATKKTRERKSQESKAPRYNTGFGRKQWH